MKRSTHRILTTHVGSLARPEGLIPFLRQKERAQAYDADEFTLRVREAVADAVRKQVEAGIDVVTDGEQGKASFFGYIVERFTGFERRPPRAGQESNPRSIGREYLAFPDYYAWSERIAEWAGGRGGDRRYGIDTCSGPVSYKGQAFVRADIDTLKAALEGLPHEEVFLPAIAPSYIAATLPNEHYRTEEEYEQAIADALRQEYQAIVDAGFILQIDDPRLVTYYNVTPEASIEDCRRWAARRVEILNHALRGLPRDRIRFHTCYGINIGPRTHDMELKHVVDLILNVNAGAYSFEAGNPRHEHEWRVWKDAKVPAGTILIPGVITHSNVMVEHPETIADRIVRFAEVVGRENVIAGVDCGFGTFAGSEEIQERIVWAKFDSLAKGAELASRRLWGR
jgi:5-methyltetrahydropteroyltriglutamate--homocysteine methyltransferase